MKLILHSFLWGYFLLGSGCQRVSEPGNSAERAHVILRFKLPSGFQPQTVKFQHLKERAVVLRLTLRSDGGLSQVFDLPPNQWESFSLPELNFPVFPKDVLKVRAEIWDKAQDGLPRPFAAFLGKATLAAKDTQLETPNHLPVRLSAQVPAKEYD